MANNIRSRVGNLISTMDGEVQAPPFHKALLATLLTSIFYIGLILTFAMPTIISFLPQSATITTILNRLIELIKDNHILFILFLFGCNVAAGQMTQTGAFEIDVAGERIWSKLETGELPSVGYIIEQIKEAAATK